MIEGEDEQRVYDHGVLYEDLNELFPLVDYASIRDLEKHAARTATCASTSSEIAERGLPTLKAKEAGEAFPEMERYAMLKAVNDRWMEHLQTIEYIREGIGLRGYGQVDPLVAYKRETYDTFQHTLQGDPARRREDGLPPPRPAAGPDDPRPHVQHGRDRPVGPPEDTEYKGSPVASGDRRGPRPARPGDDRLEEGLPQRALPLRQRQEVQGVPLQGAPRTGRDLIRRWFLLRRRDLRPSASRRARGFQRGARVQSVARRRLRFTSRRHLIHRSLSPCGA